MQGSAQPAPSVFEFGEFLLNAEERSLQRGGQAVALAPKVFDTLLLLVENPGRLLRKDEIMRRLWPDSFVGDITLARNISDLRKALGENAGSPQFIETVPKSGYRFVAAVRVPGSDAVADSIPRAGLPRIAVVAITLAIVAAIGALAWWIARRAPVTPQIGSIAVLRFSAIGGSAREQALGLGMAENLKAALVSSGKLDVRDGQSSGGADPFETGRRLSVEAVVGGSVQSAGEEMRVTVSVTRVGDGKTIWARRFDGPAAGWFSLEDRAARELLGALSRDSRTPKHPTGDLEADQLYWRGKFAMEQRTLDGFRDAIRYFRSATEKDPTCALAYAGLADAWLLLSGYNLASQGQLPSPREMVPRARAAALSAINLDPTLAEPRTSLALLAENYDWDWEAAEREYRRALELNPRYVTAHHWLGEFLALTGRFDEGLAELRKAMQLDPLSPIISSDYAKCLFMARRYDEAIAQARATLEANPGFWPRKWMAAAYFQKGMIQECLETQRLDQSAIYEETVAILAARRGDTAELRKLLPTLERRLKSGQVSSFSMAIVHTYAGNRDRAFKLLDQTFERREVGLMSLKVDPSFDGLRSDPRFTALVRRLHLP